MSGAGSYFLWPSVSPSESGMAVRHPAVLVRAAAGLVGHAS